MEPRPEEPPQVFPPLAQRAGIPTQPGDVEAVEPILASLLPRLARLSAAVPRETAPPPDTLGR